MKRRIGISLLLGLSITLALTFLSALAVRLFPYRDLPMMPKPFFLFALSPGLIAGECFAHGWTTELAARALRLLPTSSTALNRRVVPVRTVPFVNTHVVQWLACGAEMAVFFRHVSELLDPV